MYLRSLSLPCRTAFLTSSRKKRCEMRWPRPRHRSSRWGLGEPWLARRATCGPELSQATARDGNAPGSCTSGGRASTNAVGVTGCVQCWPFKTHALPLLRLWIPFSRVQLEQELEQLARGVLALAPREARPAQHAGQGPSGAGEEGEGDIVLELCTPRAPAPPAAAGGPCQVGFLGRVACCLARVTSLCW